MSTNIRKVRILKETVVAYFKMLSPHLHGQTEDERKGLQSGYAVTRPKFEQHTSWMQCYTSLPLEGLEKITNSGQLRLIS
jgi:hypothetical protein